MVLARVAKKNRWHTQVQVLVELGELYDFVVYVLAGNVAFRCLEGIKDSLSANQLNIKLYAEGIDEVEAEGH